MKSTLVFARSVAELWVVRRCYAHTMKLCLWTLLFAVLAIRAPAANPIPAELVGEWRSVDGNGILALRPDGFGVVIGGPPPIGVSFQASYEPGNLTITLKLEVSPGDLPMGAPHPPDVKLSYDPKELTIKSKESPVIAYKRHSDKFPEAFNPWEPKTPWEREWAKAWAIGRGKDTDSEAAIDHMTQAIRLSPKDNEKLGTWWNYLGHLYLDRKAYDRAESAFKSHLTLIQAQPDPKPQELLSAYQALVTVYYWAGNSEGQKEALQEAVTLDRRIHGGDSAQEAGCWQRLAEIAHSSGKSKEAADMLERAIEIYSNVNDKIAPLDYLKRRLRKWRTE